VHPVLLLHGDLPGSGHWPQKGKIAVAFK